jgi:hypothetical protein
MIIWTSYMIYGKLANDVTLRIHFFQESELIITRM